MSTEDRAISGGIRGVTRGEPEVPSPLTPRRSSSTRRSPSKPPVWSRTTVDGPSRPSTCPEKGTSVRSGRAEGLPDTREMRAQQRTPGLDTALLSLIPWISSSSLFTWSNWSIWSGRLWKFRGFLESERMLGPTSPWDQPNNNKPLSPFSLSFGGWLVKLHCSGSQRS